jgi:hypothetical protein
MQKPMRMLLLVETYFGKKKKMRMMKRCLIRINGYLAYLWLKAKKVGRQTSLLPEFR